jgi:hypothetical protein
VRNLVWFVLGVVGFGLSLLRRWDPLCLVVAVLSLQVFSQMYSLRYGLMRTILGFIALFAESDVEGG